MAALNKDWISSNSKVRLAFSELTAEEIEASNGDVDRLISMLISKTGESEYSIRQKIDDAMTTQRDNQLSARPIPVDDAIPVPASAQNAL